MNPATLLIAQSDGSILLEVEARDLLAVTRTLVEMKGLPLTKSQSIRAADPRQFAKRPEWLGTQILDGHP